MSKTYISPELRQQVAEQAKFQCEYCLIHEEDTYLVCQVDHIISEKHGGPTTLDNLAYACVYCNRFKGSDVGSVLWPSGELVRFYNPRTDHWADHFQIEGVTIIPLTNIGEVTIRVFKFNHIDRLLERQELIARGRYP